MDTESVVINHILENGELFFFGFLMSLQIISAEPLSD